MKVIEFTHEVRKIKHVTGHVIHPMILRLVIGDMTTGYANALRRVILGEIPIKVLVLDEFECGDKYVKPETVAYQLSTIKIDQGAKIGAKCTVSVSGDKIPTTSDIKGGEIVTNPGVRLIEQVQFTRTPTKIGMHVAEYKKNKQGQKSASLVSLVGFKQMDPPNPAKASAGRYEFIIEMHDNIEPKTLMKLAIDQILTSIEKMRRPTLNLMSRDGDLVKYRIILDEETSTLGGIIYDIVYLIDPEIPMITYHQNTTQDVLKLYIEIVHESEEIIKKILDRAVNLAADQWLNLKKQF